MILTHKITLDLAQRGDRPSIDAVQGDTARAVEISLMDNGAAWTVPEGTSAVVCYRRIQGGIGGIYDTMPDGSPAYAIGQAGITVFLAPQVLGAAGPVELQVTLQKDGAELTCFAILIHVQGNLFDVEPDAESYVNLTEHIRAAVEGMDLGKQEKSIHYVQGDSGSSSGKWLGTCPEITAYYEGLLVAYRTIASGGGSSTTLNINGLGAVPVKRNGTGNEVNYYYSSGSVIFLAYTVVNGTATWQLTDNWFLDSDQKTSATSTTNTKLLLIGSKNALAGGIATYCNTSCYIGTDNCLYSNGVKVATAEDMAPEVADYVRTEAERVAARVQSRQNANTISFMLGSDIHARLGHSYTDRMLESTRHAAQAMKIIADRVHLDFVGLLGDYLWDEGENPDQAREMYRMISEFFTPAFRGLPQFWCKGNHDGLDDENHVDQLTGDEVFSAIGLHNAGAVYNSADRGMGYCHRDFEEYRLRVVCMNTTKDYNIAVDTPQNNWLKTVLDVQSGWKVIILSHIPLDWWGTGSTVYQTVAGFAGKVLCNIHGHVHNYVTGHLGNSTIIRIAVPNIDFYRPNSYQGISGMEQYVENQTYGKTADSAQDTAFCVMTLDLEQNKLYADHYGAGCDRVVDLNTGDVGSDEGGEEGGYTNQIPRSTTTFGGSVIYNGTGYKTSYRINSSFEEQSVTSGMCCTGFIAVKPGDTVRVKGVTLSGSATAYLVRYTTTGGNQVTDDISVLGSPDADGVYTYTVPASTGAIRLSVGVINGNSVVTVNEVIE